jgi:glycosyltransferase involved in cell wall biosynthesis
MTISGQELLRPAPPEGAARPLVSVVVPTKNERGNVATLVERLDAALPTVAMEIVFVDDSTDGTAELVEEIAPRTPRDVVLLRQASGRRIGGLGGAVVQGIRAARAPWVCVMDADLQHPPELITALLEQAESRDLDLVVASRYCKDGDAGSFGWARAMASRSTTTAARMLFPRRLRDVSDPMSGFFLVRRDAVAVDRLRPRGFKILLSFWCATRGSAPARSRSPSASGAQGGARRRSAKVFATSRSWRGCDSRASAPSACRVSWSTRCCSRS